MNEGEFVLFTSSPRMTDFWREHAGDLNMGEFAAVSVGCACGRRPHFCARSRGLVVAWLRGRETSDCSCEASGALDAGYSFPR